MFKRLVLWSAFITIALLAGLFWYIDNTPPSAETVERPDTISVTHMVKDGAQRFVGEITLPHSCYRIVSQEYVPDIEDTDTGVLDIKTQDLKLELRTCFFVPTNYPFDILTDNERKLAVTLRVDDKEIPISIRDRGWQSSSGTVVTPPPNLPR
jgi:hypothetical protein